MKFCRGNFIATEPFKETSVKSEVKNGFAFMTQKSSLTGLKVLFGNKDHKIDSNNIAFVASDQFKQPWATRVMSVDGVEFILVPIDAVYLIQQDA